MTVAACALVLAGIAGGEDLPTSRLADSPAYDSIDDAARAALAIAMPKSGKFEWGGILLRMDTSYFYTEAVTSSSGEFCEYSAQLPPAAVPAGLYHTHTAHDMDGYFSAADIALARRIGVKSYVGVARTGRIRVFDPATMHPYEVRRRNANYGSLARGTVLPEQSRPAVAATDRSRYGASVIGAPGRRAIALRMMPTTGVHSIDSGDDDN
jgi:hypothetical protein